MKQYSLYCHRIGVVFALLFACAIPLSTSATTVTALGAMLMWCFSGDWSLKRKLLFQHPISQCIWIFVGYFLLTSIYSVASTDALMSGVRDIIRLTYIPILMYYFYPAERARLALWLFVTAMLVTFVLAVLKMYVGVPIGDHFNYAGGVYEVSAAVFKSHIKTNFFMAIAAFFLAERAIVLPKYRGILLVLLGLLCFYIFYMSWGRTGQAIFVFLGLLLLFQTLKQWSYRLVGLAVLALSLGLVYLSSDTLQLRVAQVKQDIQIYETGGPLGTSSIGSRIAFAKHSVVLAEEQRWWGSGLGSFAERYAQAFPQSFLTDNPHNEYLLVWVETGLVGGLLLIAFILIQLYLTRRLPIDVQKMAQGVVLAFFIGCLANSWLHDFTESNFYVLMMSVLFARLPLYWKKPYEKTAS